MEEEREEVEVPRVPDQEDEPQGEVEMSGPPPSPPVSVTVDQMRNHFKMLFSVMHDDDFVMVAKENKLFKAVPRRTLDHYILQIDSPFMLYTMAIDYKYWQEEVRKRITEEMIISLIRNDSSYGPTGYPNNLKIPREVIKRIEGRTVYRGEPPVKFLLLPGTYLLNTVGLFVIMDASITKVPPEDPNNPDRITDHSIVEWPFTGLPNTPFRPGSFDEAKFEQSRRAYLREERQAKERSRLVAHERVNDENALFNLLSNLVVPPIPRPVPIPPTNGIVLNGYDPERVKVEEMPDLDANPIVDVVTIPMRGVLKEEDEPGPSNGQNEWADKPASPKRETKKSKRVSKQSRKRRISEAENSSKKAKGAAKVAARENSSSETPPPLLERQEPVIDAVSSKGKKSEKKGDLKMTISLKDTIKSERTKSRNAAAKIAADMDSIVEAAEERLQISTASVTPSKLAPAIRVTRLKAKEEKDKKEAEQQEIERKRAEIEDRDLQIGIQRSLMENGRANQSDSDEDNTVSQMFEFNRQKKRPSSYGKPPFSGGESLVFPSGCATPPFADRDNEFLFKIKKEKASPPEANIVQNGHGKRDKRRREDGPSSSSAAVAAPVVVAPTPAAAPVEDVASTSAASDPAAATAAADPEPVRRKERVRIQPATEDGRVVHTTLNLNTTDAEEQSMNREFLLKMLDEGQCVRTMEWKLKNKLIQEYNDHKTMKIGVPPKKKIEVKVEERPEVAVGEDGELGPTYIIKHSDRDDAMFNIYKKRDGYMKTEYYTGSLADMQPECAAWYESLRDPAAPTRDWARRPIIGPDANGYVYQVSGATVKIALGADVTNFPLDPLHNHREFRLGDIVWGKFQLEYWPARIIAFIPAYLFDDYRGDGIMLAWFDTSYTYVSYKDVYRFDMYFSTLYTARKTDKLYTKNVATAIAVDGKPGYWEKYINKWVYDNMVAIGANTASIPADDLERLSKFSKMKDFTPANKVAKQLEIINKKEIQHFEDKYKTVYGGRNSVHFNWSGYQEYCNNYLTFKEAHKDEFAEADDLELALAFEFKVEEATNQKKTKEEKEKMVREKAEKKRELKAIKEGKPIDKKDQDDRDAKAKRYQKMEEDRWDEWAMDYSEEDDKSKLEEMVKARQAEVNSIAEREERERRERGQDEPSEIVPAVENDGRPQLDGRYVTRVNIHEVLHLLENFLTPVDPNVVNTDPEVERNAIVCRQHITAWNAKIIAQNAVIDARTEQMKANKNAARIEKEKQKEARVAARSDRNGPIVVPPAWVPPAKRAKLEEPKEPKEKKEKKDKKKK